jgi:hypothetical protein
MVIYEGGLRKKALYVTKFDLSKKNSGALLEQWLSATRARRRLTWMRRAGA